MIAVNNNNSTVDLGKFRALESKMFTGRDRGESVRKSSKLDEIESANESVIVIIPKEIESINPSFFEELFSKAIIKLGREKFLEKFKFVNEGTYKYEVPLQEAIQRVLRRKTALG